MKYLNKNFFKKLRGNLKLMKKKTMNRISALSLATVLLLTGCSVKENTNINSNPNNFSNSSTNIILEDNPIVEFQTNLTEDQLKVLEQEVTIDEQDYNGFLVYLHERKVSYENSQYFQILEALENYRNIKEYETQSSNFIQNGKINEEALKKQVIKNNSEFLEKVGIGKYNEFDKKTFEKVFSILIEGLNYQLQSGVDIDIAQLDDNLTHLRMLRMTSHGSGMVTDDGIFALNLDVIESKQPQYPNVDILRMVVLHEGNHLVQLSSVKERENEGSSRNLGIAYSWDNLEVNPLLYTWYTESSAEYLKNFQYGNGSVTAFYENQVKSLESLTLATILKEGVNEKSLAQLSLQPDLNRLFEIFNCNTEDDKIEVLQMMYAIEIYSNQPAEFNNFYMRNIGKNLEIYRFHDSLRTSVGQTLTKKFYENLATYTIQNNSSLKDIFSMMSTFELEMIRLAKNSPTFVNMYQNIQNKYFTAISKSLNMSNDELLASYIEYYHDGISQVNQANVSIGEATFINKLLQSRTSFKNQSISEIGLNKVK